MYKLSTIVVVLVVLLVGIGQSSANKRSYSAGHFALMLDGETSSVSSTEGGGATSDVVVESIGGDPIQRKHIGGVKYEDIAMSCGLGMSKGMYSWIKDSFDNKTSRKSGSIIAADYDYKAQQYRDFQNALITEIGFPALDAASKDAAMMTVKFSPETIIYRAGKGEVIPGVLGAKQKKWLTSNFRIRLGDLPCARVSKIDSFTIKQGIVTDPVGGREPGKIEIPNLTITLPDLDSQPWHDWFDDFVIKGNNGQDKELSGQLDYLDQDLKSSLFTLEFQNVGIFRLAPDSPDAGSDGIRRVKAEMYCEQMKFNYSPTFAQ